MNTPSAPKPAQNFVGEILAIRQMLGHRRLPEYVGDIETKATYRHEPG